MSQGSMAGAQKAISSLANPRRGLGGLVQDNKGTFLTLPGGGGGGQKIKEWGIAELPFQTHSALPGGLGRRPSVPRPVSRPQDAASARKLRACPQNGFPEGQVGWWSSSTGLVHSRYCSC